MDETADDRWSLIHSSGPIEEILESIESRRAGRARGLRLWLLEEWFMMNRLVMFTESCVEQSLLRESEVSKGD